MAATVKAFGPDAALIELGDCDPSPAAVARLVRDRAPWESTDIVPAACTVLVAGPSIPTDAIVRFLAEVLPELDGERTDVTEPPIELAVVYDGPDLGVVAEQTGLSVADVVEAHCSAAYAVAFCGFAPGFAYLSGLDDRLVVPRRPDPRPTVPAGSVAIADRFSAVYPSESPGGWHLLGRTTARVWDVARRPPALLAPGTAVRFVPRSAR